MAYLDDIYAVLQVAPTGVPTYVRLSQNENGRRMIFSVVGGEIPSGSTATISGTKPDGVVYSATCTISGSTVTVNETIQLTAAAGEWDAKIKIMNSGNTIATGRIRFVVDADAVAPGSVPSDSELEGLVAEAAGYAEQAQSAVTELRNNVGVIQLGTGNTGSTTVPDSSVTKVNEITLTAGSWIIVACADWNANGTGWRQLAIDKSATDPARNSAVTTPAIANGKQTYQQCVMFVSPSSTTTIPIYCAQTSGSALAVYSYVYAIKVSV